MKDLKPWTDDEMGLIADRLDMPAIALAAELGRSANAIYKAKARIRRGWTREREAWTQAEDTYLLSAPTNLSAAQIASKLPGRTPDAVKHRRKKLNLPHARPGNIYSPYAIADRFLIAKTCRKCGHLLPGEKFYSRKSRVGYLSECAYCISEYQRGYPRRDSRAPGEKANVMSRWTRRAQELTARVATRSRLPYLESDFAVLADPRLSIIAKALKLKRTYSAVNSACARNSYASNVGAGYGLRSDAEWLINNPNADRVDEITAALKQEFESAGVKFPEWDWDDEDLKESA